MRLAEPKKRRWTQSEYSRLGELGMFRDRRVELIDGEIVEMAAQKDTHVISVSLGNRALMRAFGAGYWVRVQSPLNFGRHNNPEPDLAVVVGSERDYLGSDNRVDPLLVVEVSDTTLLYDRGRKARLYARKGVADYWIVNIPDRQLEVYRSPARQAGRWRFTDVSVHHPTQAVTPIAARTASILVADLLP